MPGTRASRTESAYRHLTDAMMRGRWQAGDVLSTYALTEELEMSRTPILEALKRLEAEGLVEIIPQVGCRVVAASTSALDELFAVRAALEGLGAATAAREADAEALDALELLLRRLEAAAADGDRVAYDDLNERFHLRMVDASGMSRLSQTARGVWAPLRYQLARLRVSDDQLRASQAEHRELHAALRARSPGRARAAAERHVRLAAARFVGELGPRPPDPFVHRALVYHDDPGFLATTVPFVEEGLRAGERVLAVTTARNAEALARELGPRGGEVEFRDSDDWYVVPSHTLLSYERYVEHAGRRRVRIIGEVTGGGASPAPMREWTRYESILNVAFASQPVTILCPYDARRLPERIVADAGRTHPELCAGTDVHPSARFTDVPALVRELDGDAFDEPRAPAAACEITAELRDVRTFILDRAKRAGVRGKAIQDTFLAVQEVASAVISDGRGHGSVRSWVQDGELLYEVRDEGSGIGDPLVGQLTSDPALTSEPRGLWMARLLCDLVEARAHEHGLVVRLHVALGETPAV